MWNVWNGICQEVKDVDVGFMCIKEGWVCLTCLCRRGLSTLMRGRGASGVDKRSYPLGIDWQWLPDGARDTGGRLLITH